MLAHLGSKDRVALNRFRADTSMRDAKSGERAVLNNRVTNSLRARDINWA